MAEWFEPALKHRLNLPAWRLFAEYYSALRRASIGAYEELRCYMELLKWLFRKKRALAGETIRLIRHITNSNLSFMKKLHSSG